jgi:hypothetical protein
MTTREPKLAGLMQDSGAVCRGEPFGFSAGSMWVTLRVPRHGLAWRDARTTVVVRS